MSLASGIILLSKSFHFLSLKKEMKIKDGGGEVSPFLGIYNLFWVQRNIGKTKNLKKENADRKTLTYIGVNTVTL